MHFTCPTCKRTSHNPQDAQQGYCGNCHEYTGVAHSLCPSMLAASCREAMEKTVEHFKLEGDIPGMLIVSNRAMAAPGFDPQYVDCVHGVRYWVAPDPDMADWLKRLSPAD